MDSNPKKPSIARIIDGGYFFPDSGDLEHGVRYYRHNTFLYKEKYNAINRFYSSNDICDEFLKEAHRHDECVTLLFFSEEELIAFCSICCASLHVHDLLHPAIEFRYFAIAHKLWGAKFNGSNVKISGFIFESCMLYAYVVSQNILAAEYFILQAKNDKRVRNFYNKHGFIELTNNMRLSTDETFSQCVPAFIKLPGRYSQS